MTEKNAAKSEKKPPQGLLRSTFVVSSMTLMSRFTGLARDVVFSRWFGASPLMDAFFIAFKIPNLFRRFFAEGAFSAAFVPVLANTKAVSTNKTLIS